MSWLLFAALAVAYCALLAWEWRWALPYFKPDVDDYPEGEL